MKGGVVPSHSAEKMLLSPRFREALFDLHAPENK
jgi:hypothetical protein